MNTLPVQSDYNFTSIFMSYLYTVHETSSVTAPHRYNQNQLPFLSICTLVTYFVHQNVAETLYLAHNILTFYYN